MKRPLQVLVTGGAGFIGSHVVDAYLAAGHQVTVVDNLTTGRRDNVNGRAECFHVDIRSSAIEAIIQRGRFDVINHHAAHIDVRGSVACPWHDAEVNVLGTLNVLECARQHRVRDVIFASTGGAIYGETGSLPAQESQTARPSSPYGVAKLAVEHYLQYYQAIHDLRCVVLRYANVYGPRQDPHGEAGVVAIFIHRVLQGERPVINGDGRQTRDFVFVGDVVRANLLALDYLRHTRSSGNGGPLVVNVGTGQELSVNELYAQLKKIDPDALEPIYAPAKPGDQHRSAVDPSCAKRALGWEPLVPLDVGLRETWNWFKAKSAYVSVRRLGG